MGSNAQSPDQDWRRDRLAELLQHEQFGGNKAALGRALGYENGAHVRQMLADERPITEKTVARVHAMLGGKFRGWFDRAGLKRAAPAWPVIVVTIV